MSQENDLLNKMRGVAKYVIGLKEREPGYFYDNFDQFNSLMEEMKALEGQNLDMMDIMLFLQVDIEIVKDRMKNPIRTPEEEKFYRHIVGVNSYIWETKQRDNSYIFDAIGEVDDLLYDLEELNTWDPDTLEIMDIITKDIKQTISSRNGNEAAEKYQERLDKLNIGENNDFKKIKEINFYE